MTTSATGEIVAAAYTATAYPLSFSHFLVLLQFLSPFIMRFHIPLGLAALFLPFLCIAAPEADPQTYTNNAPFSGAIYIVSPDGQQITTTNSNMCPNYASVSCSSINAPSW